MSRQPPSSPPAGLAGSVSPSTSEGLRRLYGRDYFAGVTSGYPAEGYAVSHPDWGPWLDLIGLLQPGGRLLDLGCAFAYLVREARGRGYQAFGLDISPYALGREPGIGGLIEGDLQFLPVADSCADVVALFDVLEHLAEPELALAEAVRVLAPEGLLVGTTPDPIFLGREEPTHIFERPPSFWLDRLRRLGLDVCFRFSEEDYNFQFVASRPGSSLSARLCLFQHDYFSTEPDFFHLKGSLQGVPRSGWGPLCGQARGIRGRAAFYLLNPGPSPLHCEVSFRAVGPRCATLRTGYNSTVLGEWVLTSEQAEEHFLRLPPIEVPRGGHHLWFEVRPDPDGVRLRDIRIESSPGSSDDLILSLPFDLFQRYRLAGQICDLLEPVEVLDVGGVLGDEGGHLATSRDFLFARDTTREPEAFWSTDARHGDWPDHRPAPAWAQPFADRSFDLVLSLDVLEHLPKEDRIRFLDELDRVARKWILLSAPFSDPDVEKAEEILQAGLLSARRFLREHRERGLPSLDGVRRHYQSRGYTVSVVPNGYLPRWKSMQVLTCLYFGLRDWVSFSRLNRLYNREVYPLDQREPAYRHHLLISKTGLDPATASGLAALFSDTEAIPDPTAEVLGHPDFVETNQRLLERLQNLSRGLLDTQFLFGEREKLIALLQQDLRNVRAQVEELRRETPLRSLFWERLQRRLETFRKRGRPAGSK